jgi:hypothetical protein
VHGLLKEYRQEAYEAALQDKPAMDALETKTQEYFKGFKSTGEEVSKVQTVFIGHLMKVAEMIDKKIFTPTVAAASGLGAGTFIAGVLAIAAGGIVGTGIVALGGALAATTGVTVAALPPLVKAFKNNPEIRDAQKSYEAAIEIVGKLYKQYQEIMDKILHEQNFCPDHPEAHNLLFAHLAGVHMHGAKTKGVELCPKAKKLATFHKLRKLAKELPEKEGVRKSKPLDISPHYSLPVGFNLLASGVDVVHTVGATLELTQNLISKKSEDVDARLLRDSCILTLQREKDTIIKLCIVEQPADVEKVGILKRFFQSFKYW